MDLHLAVRDVVDMVGVAVLDDADSFRGVLDDVLDESAVDVGDINLLVDAVRFGCFDQLLRLLESDADPAMAVTTVGDGLARLRGGSDPRAARWACAVLGFAVRRVPDSVVRDLEPRQTVPDTVPDAMAEPVPEVPPGAVPDRPVAQPTSVATDVTPSPTLRVEDAPSRPPAGRRTVVWLSSVAVGVVVAGLVLFLVLDGESPRGTAADTGTNGDGSGQDAQCWNGEAADALSACPIPSDVAGLAWVFPGSTDEACDPDGPGPPTRKVVQRYCSVPLADGGEVQVHYSQWLSHSLMVDHYEGVRLGRDFEVGRSDLASYEIESPDQHLKVVLFYRHPDAPFSVTVYADSEDDLYAAADQLMIRPVEQLRGLGPDQEELPASVSVER